MNIIHCFRAPVGGLFRHVADLAQAQSSAGHAVGLICDSTTGGAFEEQTFERIAPSLSLGILRIAMPRGIGPSDLPVAWRIANKVRALDPDILHGHGAKGGAYGRVVGTLLRATGSSVARIYTPHGGSLHYEASTATGRIYFGLERLLSRLTDGFAFVSRFERDSFATKVGAPKRPAVVVPNGLRSEEFEPVNPAPDAVDFLFIGALRDIKGPDVFIEAFNLLKTQPGPDPTGLIVGDGPEKSRYLDLVRKRGLDDAITFAGPMPAREAFARARAVVIPSRAESMPYIVLESLAAGMPTIATRVGGVPEIFGDHADTLIPPANPDRLADAMAAQMAEGSRTTPEQANLRQSLKSEFSVAAMAKQVAESYRLATER